MEQVTATNTEAYPVGTTPDDLLAEYDSSEATDSQTNDSAPDTPQTEVKADSPVKEEEAPSPDDSKEDSPEDQAEQETVKSFKAKLGDKDVDIPEEAILSHEINGKKFNFKVADAVDALVGQEKFNRKADQRMTYIVNREKAVETAEQAVDDKAREIIEQSIKGDPMLIFRSLARMAAGKTGLDPIKIEEAYLNHLDEIGGLWTKMSPEQRNAFLLKRRAEEAERKNKVLEEKHTQTTGQVELERQIRAWQSQESISDDQLVAMYETIVEDVQKRGQESGLNEQQIHEEIKKIPPQKLFDLHNAVKHRRLVIEAAAEISDSISQDEDIIDEVVAATKGKNLSYQDVKDLVAEINKQLAAPSASVKSLNEKLSDRERAQLKKPVNSKKQTTKEDEQLEELFFNLTKRNAQISAIQKRYSGR